MYRFSDAYYAAAAARTVGVNALREKVQDISLGVNFLGLKLDEFF